MSSPALLDPVVIAQLGNLQLRARRILEGVFSGRHVNRTKGQSQEFSEHRPYYPGDEIKTLDWKIFGRTDRLVVRQFQNETTISGVLILDDSASMGYKGGGPVSKMDYVKTMAAALGYLCVVQNDPISLLTSTVALPPNSQKGHLETVFQTLEKIQPHDEWDLDAMIRGMRAPIRRRSLMMVFSDLMGPVEKFLHPLKSLQAQRNEVIVFHVADPWELDLPQRGAVQFEDLETGETIQTEPEVIRAEFQKIMARRIESFKQSFRSNGIDYVLLRTTTPFDKGMGKYLSWRGRAR